jgi:hypothetical protein
MVRVTRMTRLARELVLVALTGGAALMPHAQAQQSIYVPLFSFRTGPFAGAGIPIANGMADYLNMLNERDGGIGGVRLTVEECKTGYLLNRLVGNWWAGSDDDARPAGDRTSRSSGISSSTLSKRKKVRSRASIRSVKISTIAVFSIRSTSPRVSAMRNAFRARRSLSARICAVALKSSISGRSA